MARFGRGPLPENFTGDRARHWSLKRLQKSIRCDESEVRRNAADSLHQKKLRSVREHEPTSVQTRTTFLRPARVSAMSRLRRSTGSATVSMRPSRSIWLYVARQRAAVHDKSSGQFTHCGCCPAKDLVRSRELRRTKAGGCNRLVVELRHRSRCFSHCRAIAIALHLSNARADGSLNGLGHSRLSQVVLVPCAFGSGSWWSLHTVW